MENLNFSNPANINQSPNEVVKLNEKIAKLTKVLDQKTKIIHGLENDLEHVIQQVTSHKSFQKSGSATGKWINRTLPGISHC